MEFNDCEVETLPRQLRIQHVAEKLTVYTGIHLFVMQHFRIYGKIVLKLIAVSEI